LARGPAFAMAAKVRIFRSECTFASPNPANPYGAALPWPESDSRPQRAGFVATSDGFLYRARL